jgi:hypothetical protein
LTTNTSNIHYYNSNKHYRDDLDPVKRHIKLLREHVRVTHEKYGAPLSKNLAALFDAYDTGALDGNTYAVFDGGALVAQFEKKEEAIDELLRRRPACKAGVEMPLMENAIRKIGKTRALTLLTTNGASRESA